MKDGSSNFPSVALHTTEELLPLYSFDAEDTPSKALGGYPNPTRIIEALKILIDVMLPGRFSLGVATPEDLQTFISERLVYAAEILGPEIERAVPFRWVGQAAQRRGAQPVEDVPGLSNSVLEKFFAALPETRRLLTLDVRAAYEGDPAALSFAEVQLAYPGLLAVASHRLAHKLYELDVPIVPRIMSEWTHTQTGVDIHPGATIGEAFFIDHGTGVVIGETAVVGARVKIYQGATLGARSFPLDDHGQPVKHIKRHPTVEDDSIIYAHAVILGGDTVIGKGSTIGGGVCVMESVPPRSLVVASRPELTIKSVSK